MLHIFITFLAVASRFASADELCSRDINEVCPIEEGAEPEGFPTTAEELKKSCDFAIKLLDCGIEYEERCHRMPDMFPAAYDMYAILHEVCNPDSLLHEAVANNLACFRDTMDNEGSDCFDYPTQETLDMQARELVKEGFEGLGEDSEDENAYACLTSVNTFACQALALEQKCGTDAMSAFVDVIQRSTSFVMTGCNEQTIKMLPSVIRLTQLENEIEEALKRRRK